MKVPAWEMPSSVLDSHGISINTTTLYIQTPGSLHKRHKNSLNLALSKCLLLLVVTHLPHPASSLVKLMLVKMPWLFVTPYTGHPLKLPEYIGLCRRGIP